MWVFEFGDEIIICDMGVMFPETEMMGVDLVLPDISYLRDKSRNIRGVLISHGHEDHIGAIPYLLPDLGFPPVLATTLTQGLITNKLKEHKLLDKAVQRTIQPGERIALGAFTVEPFHVAHSIPDAVGFGITCPAGLAVYMTDWKFDHTPVDGWPTDIAKLSEFGRRNPLVLLTDCVRVEAKGHTPSERVVGEAIETIFATAPGRIILATFASNISRVQMVIDAAVQYDRKVVPAGRSMENNVRIAQELGYLTVPDGVLIRLSEANQLPADQVAIVCTGSQGEPMAALARMANRDYPHVRIQEGDTVVLSASPIPGNEVSVSRVINNLFKLGADVIYGHDLPVHVSGHAAEEELKMALSLLRPQFVVPFHGDYRHMVLYRRMAVSMGYAPETILMPEVGSIMEFSQDYGEIVGRAPAGYIFVDGVTVGDIGSVVVRDRQMLAKDGIVLVVVSVDQHDGTLVAGPDIVSRGFISLRDQADLIEGTREAVRNALTNGVPYQPRQISGGEEVAEGNAPGLATAYINRRIKDTVSRFLYEQTRRRPMVIPVVMEI